MVSFVIAIIGFIAGYRMRGLSYTKDLNEALELGILRGRYAEKNIRKKHPLFLRVTILTLCFTLLRALFQSLLKMKRAMSSF